MPSDSVSNSILYSDMGNGTNYEVPLHFNSNTILQSTDNETVDNDLQSQRDTCGACESETISFRSNLASGFFHEQPSYRHFTHNNVQQTVNNQEANTTGKVRRHHQDGVSVTYRGSNINVRLNKEQIDNSHSISNYNHPNDLAETAYNTKTLHHSFQPRHMTHGSSAGSNRQVYKSTYTVV